MLYFTLYSPSYLDRKSERASTENSLVVFIEQIRVNDALNAASNDRCLINGTTGGITIDPINNIEQTIETQT